MARASRPIRYKTNGIILGKPALGKKVQDYVTGFWTYEARLAVNEFGEMVDSRGEGMDRNESFPATQRMGPP